MTQRVYDYLLQYKEDTDGGSPSVREIMEALGIASTSTVAFYLDHLEDQGAIELAGDARSRSIRIVGANWTAPPDPWDATFGLGKRERKAVVQLLEAEHVQPE